MAIKFEEKYLNLLKSSVREILNVKDDSLGSLVQSLSSIPDKLVSWNAMRIKIKRLRMKKEKELDELIASLISRYKSIATSATQVNNFARYEIYKSPKVKKLRSEIIDLSSLENLMEKIGKLGEKKLEVYLTLIKIDKDLLIKKYTKKEATIVYKTLEELLDNADWK